MACAGYNNCRENEMKKLRFPVDENSLYGQRLYDQQTADSRCYSMHPMNIQIKEGFGSWFTWDMLIKVVIAILIVVLLYSLYTEYNMTEVSMSGGGYVDSHFALTPISLLGE